jgi:hypothetical protein
MAFPGAAGSNSARTSARIAKRWLNALKMAGSHGALEAATTSVAVIKSANQAALRLVPGKAERRISSSCTRRKREPEIR